MFAQSLAYVLLIALVFEKFLDSLYHPNMFCYSKTLAPSRCLERELDVELAILILVPLLILPLFHCHMYLLTLSSMMFLTLKS